MIYLAWTAFGLALGIVAAMVVLVRVADEELLEDDLRHELSDISFRKAGE
jgi:hypothetical protein